MSKQLTTTLGFALAMLLLFSTQASAMYTTYQAKIIKPDGIPLEATNVNFRFTILDPLGACVLYTENFNTINMAGSGGLVNFSLGSGIKTFPVSGSVNFSDVFDNHGAALSCATGGPPSYIPAANDLRKIVMQFHDGAGWQTLPAMNINHVPYAMYAKNAASATTAINSTQLNGKTDLDFVQVSAIPACAVSQALQFNGASFGCVSVSGGGGGGSITVSGTAPIIVTGTVSSPQISISVASMSSDGYLTAADYAEFKTKLSASSTEIVNTLGFAPVSSSAVAAQISAAAAVSNTANALVLRDSSGNIWANDVYSNTAKTNYVDIFKPSTAFSIRLQAPTSLSASYNLIFPSDDGLNGQVLATDGSGNLSWVSQTQTITSSDVVTALGYTPAASGSFTSSQWNTSGTTINYMAGNVGIGTSTPGARLQVVGSSTNDSYILVNNNSGGAYQGYFGVQDTSGGGNAAGVFVGSSSNHPFSIRTNEADRLIIDTSGNVSINPNKTIFAQSTVGTEAGEIELYNSTTHNMNFRKITSGNFVFSGGNVGIGMSAPGASLDVVKSGASSYTGVKTNITSTAGNATGFDTTVNGFNYSTGVLVDATSTKTTVGVDVWASVTTSGGSYVRGVNVGIDDDLVPGSALRLYGSTGTALSKAIEISSGFNSGYAIYADTNGKSYFKGNVGIGTSTPVTALQVSGGVRISMESATCAASYAGTLRYNSGNVEFCNGISWSSFGVAGAGITNFNGSTSGSQTFANGTAGTAPLFVTTNGVHTLNIPLASVGSVTAGLISNTDYTTFTNKITSSSASIAQVLGYTPAASGAIPIADLTDAYTNSNDSIFIGAGSPQSGTASNNTALGVSALALLTNGSENVAIGNEALYSNTSGYANTAIGWESLFSNTTGGNNTSVGNESMAANTTGYSNSALGSWALYRNTTGGFNVALGEAAIDYNTSGNYNIGIGVTAGRYNANGNYNTFLGSNAGRGQGTNLSNVSGSTFVGYSAGSNILTGANGNTLLGYKVGDNITTGAKNIVIGYDIDATTATVSNTLNIGNLIFGTGVNGVGTTISTGNVGIGTTSPEAKLTLDNDGGLIAKGVNGSGATLTTSGAGTRLIWYPRKAAFRAGEISSTQWDDANVGEYSTATGYNAKASGYASISMGEGTTASAVNAVAIGAFSQAMAEGTVALGSFSSALNQYATAIGESATASGTYSVAMGNSVTAESYGQLSFGTLNMPKGGENPNSWVATDPLFVVGNGTGTGASRSSALMILKNGNIGIGTTSPRATLDINGTVLMKPAVVDTTSPIDFLTGNLQYTTGNCGAFALHNMKDGGSYTFAVKGTTSTTCSFTAYSDAGSTALTLHMPTDHGATTASKHTLYTFLVMGTDLYVTWMPGM